MIFFCRNIDLWVSVLFAWRTWSGAHVLMTSFFRRVTVAEVSFRTISRPTYFQSSENAASIIKQKIDAFPCGGIKRTKLIKSEIRKAKLKVAAAAETKADVANGERRIRVNRNGQRVHYWTRAGLRRGSAENLILSLFAPHYLTPAWKGRPPPSRRAWLHARPTRAVTNPRPAHL